MHISLKLGFAISLLLTPFAADAGMFHSAPRQVYEIASVTQKPYSSLVAVAVAAFQQSDPEGLGLFPDGGAPVFRGRKALLYVVDLIHRSALVLGEIDVPAELIGNPRPNVEGWRGDELYIRFSGQTSTDSALMTSYHFSVRLDGHIEKVGQLPSNIWAGWEGQVTAEKSLSLSKSKFEVVVTDAVLGSLKGTRIVLADQGSVAILPR
jgi:hypothetical protein